MSKTKRKRYSAEFKVKFALEAIKGEQTVAELASRHGLHPTMIANWKRQTLENMAEAFTCKAYRPHSSLDGKTPDKVYWHKFRPTTPTRWTIWRLNHDGLPPYYCCHPARTTGATSLSTVSGLQLIIAIKLILKAR